MSTKPNLPVSIGTQLGYVASPTWLRAVEAGTAQPDEPVGTGPFVFDSYEPGGTFAADRNDTSGDSHNNGNYTMFLRVAQPDKPANAIHEGENLNPVKTLRLRYDEWRKTQPASFK